MWKSVKWRIYEFDEVDLDRLKFDLHFEILRECKIK